MGVEAYTGRRAIEDPRSAQTKEWEDWEFRSSRELSRPGVFEAYKDLQRRRTRRSWNAEDDGDWVRNRKVHEHDEGDGGEPEGYYDNLDPIEEEWESWVMRNPEVSLEEFRRVWPEAKVSKAEFTYWSKIGLRNWDRKHYGEKEGDTTYFKHNK
jgi:hypothetical protein